jgi:hypothetical protein
LLGIYLNSNIAKAAKEREKQDGKAGGGGGGGGRNPNDMERMAYLFGFVVVMYFLVSMLSDSYQHQEITYKRFENEFLREKKVRSSYFNYISRGILLSHVLLCMSRNMSSQYHAT